MSKVPERLKEGYVAKPNLSKPPRIDKESEEQLALVPGYIAALVQDERFAIRRLTKLTFEFNDHGAMIRFEADSQQMHRWTSMQEIVKNKAAAILEASDAQTALTVPSEDIGPQKGAQGPLQDGQDSIPAVIGRDDTPTHEVKLSKAKSKKEEGK